MSLTTAAIEPTQLVTIRAGTSERVVVETRENGWQLGRRYHACIGIGNALGRLSITDADEVYHSLLGSVPTYNAAELADACRIARAKADDLLQAAVMLDNDPTP